MKLKRKRRKKSKVEVLKARAEDLWKEICHLRDGEGCQVKKNFPEINIIHNEIYQIDHCLTRANKWYFLDVRNGTKVCSSCNLAKKNDNKSVARAIDEIVIKREGKEFFDEMIKKDQSGSPNLNFSRAWWLEDKIKGLEAQKEWYKCDASQYK